MLKEKKFREHFRDNNWRDLIFQPAEWLPSNIWVKSINSISWTAESNENGANIGCSLGFAHLRISSN